MAALMIGAPALNLLITAPAQAQGVTQSTTTVRVEQFRETLTPLGEYVQIQGLGEAWKPRDVAIDWQPYSVGRWIFNDKVGWYFRSDEPWAEITFHYGRWYDDPDHGWVWVAGTEWAPAWVEWRRSREFVGWRPLPPDNAPRRAAARTTTSRSTTTVRSRQGGTTEVIEEAWVFVPTERIVEEVHIVRVERPRVVRIYEETRPIGRVERRGTIAVNFAIRPEVIERETRVTIRAQNLPRAEAAPVPREVQSIATEARTTTTTTGSGTTTGTTGQPAGQAETPSRDRTSPPGGTANAPANDRARQDTGETAGTPAAPGATRQTETADPGTQNPNRTNAQRRLQNAPASGSQQDGSGDKASTARPSAPADVGNQANPAAADRQDNAAPDQQRRNQRQQAGEQRRNQRSAPDNARGAAEAPAEATSPTRVPSERAQGRRPTDTETTGSAPTGAGAPARPLRATPPERSGASSDDQQPPALRRAPNASGAERRSQNDDTGQPARPAQSEARQEPRSGPGGGGTGSAETTGSTGGQPMRRLPPRGAEGAAPQR